ncbi:MAG: hypothetical protein AAGE52_41970, partial [Myxococcota bacterium]
PFALRTRDFHHGAFDRERSARVYSRMLRTTCLLVGLLLACGDDSTPSFDAASDSEVDSAPDAFDAAPTCTPRPPTELRAFDAFDISAAFDGEGYAAGYVTPDRIPTLVRWTDTEERTHEWAPVAVPGGSLLQSQTALHLSDDAVALAWTGLYTDLGATGSEVHYGYDGPAGRGEMRVTPPRSPADRPMFIDDGGSPWLFWNDNRLRTPRIFMMTDLSDGIFSQRFGTDGRPQSGEQKHFQRSLGSMRWRIVTRVGDEPALPYVDVFDGEVYWQTTSDRLAQDTEGPPAFTIPLEDDARVGAFEAIAVQDGVLVAVGTGDGLGTALLGPTGNVVRPFVRLPEFEGERFSTIRFVVVEERAVLLRLEGTELSLGHVADDGSRLEDVQTVTVPEGTRFETETSEGSQVRLLTKTRGRDEPVVLYETIVCF